MIKTTIQRKQSLFNPANIDRIDFSDVFDIFFDAPEQEALKIGFCVSIKIKDQEMTADNCFFYRELKDEDIIKSRIIDAFECNRAFVLKFDGDAELICTHNL